MTRLPPFLLHKKGQKSANLVIYTASSTQLEKRLRPLRLAVRRFEKKALAFFLLLFPLRAESGSGIYSRKSMAVKADARRRLFISPGKVGRGKLTEPARQPDEQCGRSGALVHETEATRGDTIGSLLYTSSQARCVSRDRFPKDIKIEKLNDEQR